MKLGVGIAILFLMTLLSANAGAATPTAAQPTGDGIPLIYGWSVSHSATDPNVNTGSPNGIVDTLYLWLTCSGGMTAAEMTLESSPPGQILSFATMNGFLNAGTVTDLLLAVAGCPYAQVVAGSILIFHSAPVSICLSGVGTVSCAPDFQLWPSDARGYSDEGVLTCSSDSEVFCNVGPTWGSCCLPDGCVQVDSPNECKKLGGHFKGYMTFCYDGPGACCLPDGTCIELVDSEACSICRNLGGDPQGTFTKCEDCGTVSVERQSWGRTKALYR